jgi:dipeptidyl aminopeptidase/acylaminoacyl peptidase
MRLTVNRRGSSEAILMISVEAVAQRPSWNPKEDPSVTDRPPLPYGSWPSPITPEMMATSGVGIGQVAFDGEDVLWAETRPAEQGRTVLVRRRRDGTTTDVTPAGFYVRTTVHEYGGGAALVRDGLVVFSNFADQRLYRQDRDGPPVPITPEPATARGDRYADADLAPDGRRLYCVRERHTGESEPVNAVVVLPVDGSTEPVEVAAGHDFCAAPRVSPDGRRLAWLTWDHPRMPWDGTELWVAGIAGDGTLEAPGLVAGGPAESVSAPAWSPDGVLHFVADPTGWWNLYRLDPGGPVNLTPVDAELAGPQWVFGMSPYTFLADGRIACLAMHDGLHRVGLVEPGAEPAWLDLPWTAFPGWSLAGDGRRLLFAAASPTVPTAVAVHDPATGGGEVLRRSLSVDVDPEFVSVAEPIRFPTGQGLDAHALYYRPVNRDVGPPEGGLPPLLVYSHGGPTAQALGGFALAVQFWTTRGFAVVDVNYGGSTGYGRAYRERLQGQWGLVDTSDCANASRWLVQRGDADPARLAIRGGSAGGWTTLCALTFTDVFAAGASYYGVADAAALAADTHKFESRYLDGLIGPWPEARERYAERSPVHHTERLSCPLIVFQGLEDAVVPPSQAERMVAALRAKGLPHAYLAFEGEQHGFRKAETIIRCQQAELSFYAQVFGFTPAGDIEPVALVTA